VKSLDKLPTVLICLPVFIVLVCALYIYGVITSSTLNSKVDLPNIQGQVLREPQKLINIQLTNHQGQAINSGYFIGKWHVIAYGYTHCPDICPTTLFTLTQLAHLISANSETPETAFIFYTVDPRRDSQEILGQYIQYFSKNFVAIRANSSEHAEHFQQILGIKVAITNATIKGSEANDIENEKPLSSIPNYQVSHGLTILLINPEAELQAVFLPKITTLGINNFNSKVLYSDYLKIIDYYQKVY